METLRLSRRDIPLAAVLGLLAAAVLAFAVTNLARARGKGTAGQSVTARSIAAWCAESDSCGWVEKVRVVSVVPTDSLGLYTDPDCASLMAVRDSLVSVRRSLSGSGTVRRDMLRERASRLAAEPGLPEAEALRRQVDALSSLQGRNPDPQAVAVLYAEIESVSGMASRAALEPGRIVTAELSSRGRSERAVFATPRDVTALTRIF